jgi:hypothetical protein
VFEYIVGFPDNVLGGDDSTMKMEGQLSQIKSTKNEQRDLSTVYWRISHCTYSNYVWWCIVSHCTYCYYEVTFCYWWRFLVTFCDWWRFVPGDVLWSDVLLLVTFCGVTFCGVTFCRGTWVIKNNTVFTYTLQWPQVLDWAVRGRPLHSPDPSLLRPTSRLSLQWPGR